VRRRAVLTERLRNRRRLAVARLVIGALLLGPLPVGAQGEVAAAVGLASPVGEGIYEGMSGGLAYGIHVAFSVADHAMLGIEVIYSRFDVYFERSAGQWAVLTTGRYFLGGGDGARFFLAGKLGLARTAGHDSERFRPGDYATIGITAGPGAGLRLSLGRAAMEISGDVMLDAFPGLPRPTQRESTGARLVARVSLIMPLDRL